MSLQTQNQLLEIKLESKSLHFFENNLFTDAILKYDDEFFYAHKIVISSKSRWFSEYFTKNQSFDRISPIDKQIIDLPINPDKLFGNFLGIFYGKTVTLTYKTAPSYLYLAVFYGVDQVIEPIKEFIVKKISDRTVFFFVKKFIEYGLYEESKILTPYIAGQIYDIFNEPNVIRPYTLQTIYKYVSDGRVFAEILKDNILKKQENKKKENPTKKRRVDPSPEGKYQKTNDDEEEKHTYLTDDQKVQIIDEYVGERVIDNDEEREALGSVVDWTGDDSYLRLVHNKCDWLPYRISRPLLSKVISIRRNTCKTFENDCASATDTLSRWFPFVWFTSILDSTEHNETLVINIVDYISSLGHTVNYFNPEDFGLITTTTGSDMGKTLSDKFLSKNVLSADKYFVGIGNESTMPGLVINFGKNANILAKSLTIDTKIEKPYNTQSQSQRPKIYYRSPDELAIFTSFNGKESETINVSQMGGFINGTFTDLKLPSKLDSITISLRTKEEIHVLRVKSVDISGSFQSH